ncbi:MAG: 5-methyltetrahydropteroyltriglutamate--homocysteine S-methyltransferase [bacterium]|nr:5-methyltetrahydropteroyltriglutamate--homocysteine S-methyltransferase [bacterium]
MSDQNNPLSNNLGYPRIGYRRELKKATESYWKEEISLDELKKTAQTLRALNWKTQKDKGIDLIPSNDFTLYDQMLDMTALLGAIPERFGWNGEMVTEDTVFHVARGKHRHAGGQDTTASEMTKWFDTNYHYIVPELSSQTEFKLSSEKVFNEYQEAKALGIQTKPVLIGPATYLKLAKSTEEGFNPLSLLENVLPVYIQVVQKLESLGAQWIQIDEPILCLDLNDSERAAVKTAVEAISNAVSTSKIILTTYFEELRENLDLAVSLPVAALHVDLVRGVNEAESIISKFPSDKILSLGLVDGRNIWRNNYEDNIKIIDAAKAKLGNNIMIAGSCSFQHSPLTLRNETKLDAELKSWMAFADEKIEEVATLAAYAKGENVAKQLEENKAAQDDRKTNQRIHNQDVKNRVSNIGEADFNRANSFSTRDQKQREHLEMPDFPTTTIGSFPQTKEVRHARAQFKAGELSSEKYDEFIASEIQNSIKIQDDLEIDMYVHGEFERNDMVEYFGENLSGFTFTELGWVQSYGSRYVKPPIIFGDVYREAPMTVRWSQYAQSLTDKPMKGMLTGPITIIQWSFERNDQSKKDTATQIALALRDEVIDLEKAGIAAIQIDEAALREGLPLRRADWDAYLDWTVKAFRLTAAGVKDETQIHTHMCYSEFNDIIEAIAALDADVISIETSRSNMELLDAFVNFNYPNQIGPGVYDIHSPRVPTTEEMADLMRKAREVLPARNLWVNPDCGLKTRGWEEVIPALENMVQAAKQLRQESLQTA